MSHPQNLYEQDFFAWACHNAALLRSGRVAEADLEHLAEEIEDMGKAQRNALRSHLRQLLVHLLKLDYSPAGDPRRGWFEEVQNARAEIADRLADSPSLAPEAEGIMAEVWPRARRQARDALNAFGEQAALPEQCPYSLEQALDEAFFPEGPGADA
jgi:hypothetical protein